MPKRIKQTKRPTDENEIAFDLVQRSTQEPESADAKPKRQQPRPRAKQVTQSEISRVMSALGSKGGRIGGKRRLETMTAKERSRIALKAAKARWGKQKEQPPES